MRHVVPFPAAILLACLLVPAVAEAIDPVFFQPFEGLPVSRIEYTGQSITRDHVIEREMEVTVGKPLSVEDLQSSATNLENLSIFSSVRVTAERTGEDSVAIGFVLREIPWMIPSIALQITDENGVSLGPSASSVNLFGEAIKASGRLLVGGTTQFALDFTTPYLARHPRMDLQLHTALLERDDPLNEFLEESFIFQPFAELWTAGNGRIGLGGSYFLMNADKPDKTLTGDGRDHFFSVASSVGIDSRDSWRNPRSGWHGELLGQRFFGDGSWWRIDGDLRRYQPLPHPRHGLALNALVSWQSGVVGTDIPEYLQFRMGGANSIRGYDVNSLGQELFGKSQMIGTVEYRILLSPIREYRFIRWTVGLGFQLAAFWDTGVAWNEGNDFAWDRFRNGFGAGLRVLVPGVEMLRLDLGWTEDGVLRFTIRGASKFDAQRRRLR